MVFSRKSVTALGAAFLFASLSFIQFGPTLSLDRAGRLVLVEVLVLLLMALVPVISRCFKAGLKALVEPLTFMSLAVILYYALRGVILLFRHSFYDPFYLLTNNPASNSDLAKCLAYVIVGFCMFHLGYKFWRTPHREGRLFDAWSPGTLNRVAIATVCLAAGSTLVLIHVSGGLATFLKYFGCLRIITAGYGYALVGLSYWQIAFAFLFCDRLQRRKNVILALLLLFASNLCAAFVGDRMSMMASWGAAFLLYFLASPSLSPVRSTVMLTVIAAGGIGILAPMTYIRDGCYVAAMAVRAGTPSQATVPEPASYALNTLQRTHATRLGAITVRLSDEFVALDSFATVVALGPSHFPYRYGGTYLDALLFAVPRTIWPGKPRSFGVAIGQYLQHVDSDIPPGYIGELFINFHILGVALGMYLLGHLLSRAHQWAMTKDPIAITLYAVFLPYLIIFLGRSFIGTGIQMVILAVMMLPVVLVLRKSFRRLGSADDPRANTSLSMLNIASPSANGNPEVSVVIASFNTREVLRRCLNSIFEFTKGVSFEVVVVDNASSDGSVEMLKKDFPAVRLLENSRNTGFAAAQNRGLLAASGDYLLILNSDVLFAEDSITILTNYLRQSNAVVGVAGPKVMNSDGSFAVTARRSHLSTPLVVLSVFNRFFHYSQWIPQDFMRNRLGWMLSRVHDNFAPRHDIGVVEFVDGMCCFVRRQVLEQVGLFDEQFFFDFEIIDLANRIRKNGWRIIYCPATTVTHIKHSSRKKLREIVKATTNSELVYYSKYYPGQVASVKAIVRTAVRLKMSLIVASQWFKHRKQEDPEYRLLKQIDELVGAFDPAAVFANERIPFLEPREDGTRTIVMHGEPVNGRVGFRKQPVAVMAKDTDSSLIGDLNLPNEPTATIALASDHDYFVVDRLVEAYRGSGFDTRFVGWDRLDKQRSVMFYKGARCRYIMRGWSYANWSLLFALPLWYLRLFREFLTTRDNVIHALDFDCAFPAAIAGLFRKNNLIYDIQDNLEARHAFPAPVKAVLRGISMWVARRSSEIIVTDENRIIGGLEKLRHKITIVGNCPPDLNEGTHNSVEGELVVAAFGVHLSYGRGIGLLLDASARIPGVKILMAGRPVEPELEDKLRTAPQVEYLGFLPQEESLRRTCDADVVFAFYDPSIEINRRASSAKWYDAMMAGRPVISNREIINASWIEQEGFGFTCDYSEENLADLLIWLRDHPRERSERGARARTLFETRFNRDAMNRQIAEAARRASGLAHQEFGVTVNV